MNKEEKKFIERIENTFYENRGKGIKHFQKVTLYEEGITDILKLLNFVEKQQKKLEQKESILDKVTDKLKEKIELIEDVIYLCKTDGKIAKYKIEQLEEEKGDLQEILNIIEGGNNGK